MVDTDTLFRPDRYSDEVIRGWKFDPVEYFRKLGCKPDGTPDGTPLDIPQCGQADK